MTLLVGNRSLSALKMRPDARQLESLNALERAMFEYAPTAGDLDALQQLSKLEGGDKLVRRILDTPAFGQPYVLAHLRSFWVSTAPMVAEDAAARVRNFRDAVAAQLDTLFVPQANGVGPIDHLHATADAALAVLPDWRAELSAAALARATTTFIDGLRAHPGTRAATEGAAATRLFANLAGCTSRLELEVVMRDVTSYVPMKWLGPV